MQPGAPTGRPAGVGPQTPPFEKVGDVQKGAKPNTFKQEVKMNGTTYTITLKYASETSLQTAKGDMEARIEKMVLLAKEMGLGQRGLNKITLKSPADNTSNEPLRVFGKYGTSKPKKDFLDELTKDLKKGDKSDQEKNEIRRKIGVINHVIDVFGSFKPEEDHPKPAQTSPRSDHTETPHGSPNRPQAPHEQPKPGSHAKPHSPHQTKPKPAGPTPPPSFHEKHFKPIPPLRGEQPQRPYGPNDFTTIKPSKPHPKKEPPKT